MEEPFLAQSGFTLQQERALIDWQGWTPILETWTYSSTQSNPTRYVITVSNIEAPLANRYQKGEHVRLSQDNGVTYKYFYIIDVGASTITLTGGNSYAVTSATITYISISRTITPHGFNQALTHTVTVVSGLSTAALTIVRSVFSCRANNCLWHCNLGITCSGTETPSVFTLRLPVPCVATDSDHCSARYNITGVRVNICTCQTKTATNGLEIRNWDNSAFAFSAGVRDDLIFTAEYEF